MALLSKKEYAELCGMATNALSVYIHPDRSEVIVENGYIDSENETNKRFLEKRIAKGKSKSATFEGERKPNNNEGIPSYEESEQLVKFWDAKKREKEVEKLQIEVSKKKGEVIPSELMKPLILQHNQHILMEQKNADEEMLTMFAHKHSIPGADVAYIREAWINRRNAAVKSATKATVSGVESVIQDYSEKRGVGERL
jgi:hypothetical protein